MIEHRCTLSRRKVTFFLGCFFLVMSFSSIQSQCEALEATWTPNEKDGGGQLPLSQNQRQQLLELEQTITNSPNPEETLQHVAELNKMSPEDLVSMLQQNRRDLESASGAAQMSMTSRASETLPRRFLNLVYSLILMMGRYAAMNPKGFSVLMVTIMLFGYGAITAPRTGIVL